MPRGRPPKKRKPGRPKIEKNFLYDAPHNYAFWKFTLKNPEARTAFLERGSDKQKATIKEILTYLKRFDPDFFERVNGKDVLKELK